MSIALSREKAVSKLLERMRQLASARELRVEALGLLGDDPLVLVTPAVIGKGPSLLFAGCFHGDEPAGFLGILHFLEFAPREFFDHANVSFLPLVNPTGFRNNRRTNAWGEDPNRGFWHTESNHVKASREGRILIEHLDLLTLLARDGFVSLHEDVELTQFYLYTFEDSDAPGSFSRLLRDEQAKYFEPVPDGEVEGSLIRDGIIYRECDGSFEDRLFHEGVPRAACTEMPGKCELGLRVRANANIITRVVQEIVKLN